MKPLEDRILIEKIVENLDKDTGLEKTEGGIFMPVNTENYNKPNPVGKAIAVGNKCTEIKEGDTFVYARNSESEIEYEGKTHYMIRESHILFTI